MDIPQLSSSPLAGIAGTTAIAPLSAPAADDAVIVAPATPSLTTVDLSPLGRFLSASSLFQKKLIELQVSSTVPDSDTSTLGDVAAATTAFAVAFNEFQAGSLGATDADTGGGESLAGLFARRFGAETSAAGSDPDSALASLASIGVRFDADPTVDPDARLTLDLPVLQVALEVDPATTTALLARAGAAFGALVQAEVQPADLGTDTQAAAPTAVPETTAPGVPVPEAPIQPGIRATAADDQAARIAVANDLLARTLADNALSASPLTAATPASAAVPPAAPASGAEVQELVNGGSRAAAPVPQAIPATPPASAALPGTIEAEAEVARQSAETPVTRPAAEKELADRAFDLAESKRSQSAYEQERAQLAERIEVLDRQRLEQQEADARAGELQRQRDASEALRLAAAGPPPDNAQSGTTLVEQAPPLIPPLNSAQPLARDPAVAAAIAAYSLNTSPFAALNARQELAAQRVKTVPAVAGVARVAPIETQTAPKGGTRQ